MKNAANQTALERKIQEIVIRASGEIAAAVRQNIAEEVARLVGATPGIRAAAVATGAPRRRPPILCPVEDCGEIGAGPKYGWFCRDHYLTLSAAEKDEARATARTRPRRAAAAAARRAKIESEQAESKPTRARARRKTKGKPRR